MMILYQHLLWDNEMYFDQFSDRLSYERIVKLIERKERFKWLGFASSLSLYCLKFVAVSACLVAGFFAWNEEINFADVLRITIQAESIFLIRLLFKIFWLLFINTDYNPNDLQNFQPFSLLNLTDANSIDLWWRYPLSTINLFEVFFIFIVAFLLRDFLAGSLRKSLSITFSSNGVGLVVWAIVMTFLMIMSS